MPIPLNRVIAFAGPVVSILAAAIASWVVAKANVAGIDGLDEDNLATDLAAGMTFALVAVLTWLGQSKWLTGHHIELRNDARMASAALAAAAAAPVLAPVSPPADHDGLDDLYDLDDLDDLGDFDDLERVDDLPPDLAPEFVGLESASFEAELAAVVLADRVPAARLPATVVAVPPPPDVLPAPDVPPPPAGDAPVPVIDDPPPADPLPPTVADDALPDDDLAEPGDDDLAEPALETAADPPDGTPDELRVVMPSEAPLEGEPDDDDQP